MADTMNKIISVCSTFALVCALSCPAFAADYMHTVGAAASITAQATVTDLQTGEVQILDVKPIITPAFAGNTYGDDGIRTEGYEVFVPLPDGSVRLLDNEGGSKSVGGVTATLNVEYQLSTNQQNVKMTRVYGSWIPSSGLYYVTNRSVAAGQGTMGTSEYHTLHQTPQSDSFSYATNWGYSTRLPNDYAGQQHAYSEGTVYVGGMESAGGKLIALTVYFAQY